VADVRGRLDTLTYVTGDEGNREELVPVAGAQVWTATSGSGPGLVLAHGGPGMSDDLGALARMVEDLAAVHRYDQRACGRSTGQGAGQTVASRWPTSMPYASTHWGYDHWVVGGHSWGAAAFRGDGSASGR
jgi:proline iminopeptidase